MLNLSRLSFEFLILLVLYFMASPRFSFAEGQSLESLGHHPEILWRSPEMIKVEMIEIRNPSTKTTIMAQRLDFVLSGQSNQSGFVRLEKEFVLFSSSGKEFKRIPMDSIVIGKKEEEIRAGEDFQLTFRGVEGVYQVPVQFEYLNGSKTSTALNFEISNKKIILANTSNSDGTKVGNERPEQSADQIDAQGLKKNMVFLGGGVNLLRYSQTSAVTGSNVEFQSFNMPSLFFEYQHFLSEFWSIDLTVETSPGVAASSSNINVTSGAYNWNILTLQGLYTPWYFAGLMGRGRLGLIFGVQYHQVPFIRRVTLSEAEIVSNDLSMLTAGLKYAEEFWERWKFQTYMRYQYPLSVGDVFSITPDFAFDGSVSLSRRIFASSSIGVFWFGQWHEYRFSTFDRLANQEIQGEQSLFFSRFEFRYGLSF